jgi:glycosyltransferase involved in cell wall biosynthesis
MESGLGRQGRFLICGDIMPSYREILRKWLSHRSIELLGFVSDVPAVLRQCDVLVLPSLEEGSALVTYEARACGCVLVASDRSGAHCEHFKNSLIHSAGDVQTLREHLLLLKQDRNLLSQLRESSITSVKNLTWSDAGKVLAKIYRQSVAQQ